MSTRTYAVPGVSCQHCVNAIEGEVKGVPGVTAVTVDLDTRTVSVAGEADDTAVRAAIDEAGYEVTDAPT